jgi:hypothetical protein
MKDFRSTLVFRVKKAENAPISQLTGLSIAEHIITHSVETRTNTGLLIYKAMTHVTLPLMQEELSCSPTLN